jgi:hypothetical protein
MNILQRDTRDIQEISLSSQFLVMFVSKLRCFFLKERRRMWKGFDSFLKIIGPLTEVI